MGDSAYNVRTDLDKHLNMLMTQEYRIEPELGTGYTKDTIAKLNKLLKARNDMIKQEYHLAFEDQYRISKYIYQDNKPMTMKQVYDHYLNLQPQINVN